MLDVALLKVEADGRVSIPPEILQRMGLAEGGTLAFVADESGGQLLPAERAGCSVVPEGRQLRMELDGANPRTFELSRDPFPSTFCPHCGTRGMDRLEPMDLGGAWPLYARRCRSCRAQWILLLSGRS